MWYGTARIPGGPKALLQGIGRSNPDFTLTHTLSLEGEGLSSEFEGMQREARAQLSGRREELN